MKWKTPCRTYRIQTKSRKPLTCTNPNTVLIKIQIEPSIPFYRSESKYCSLKILILNPKMNILHIPRIRFTVELFHDWIPGCQSKLAQDSGSDLIFGLFAHLCIGCAVADRPLFCSCGKVKIWRSPQLSYNNPMTMSTGHMFQLSI